MPKNARSIHDRYDLILLPDDQVIGPQTAPVIVIGYCDFECPHCRQAHSLIKGLCARLPNHIRSCAGIFLSSRNTRMRNSLRRPLKLLLSKTFWRMHDVLFTNQAHLEPDDIYLYAAMAGCDVPHFKEDLLAGAGLLKVRRDMLSGRRCGVQWTPTFFVNNVLVSDSDELEQTVLGHVKKQKRQYFPLSA